MTRVGDVDVRVERGECPGLVPRGALSGEVLSHVEWLARKWSLGSDVMLLGHNSELRRLVVLAFAEACELEVEYVKLTRDTTEADLKQRRELSGSSVVFHNQAPVRAALAGRLLILDGLEQVERNVLPALNNLLENREMGLDDGGRLGSADLPVHPQFRVVALGLQTPPYGTGAGSSGGSPLDPPLRSRFSSRFVDELSAETVAGIVATSSSSSSSPRLKALLGWYESLRLMRATAVEEGASLSALPSFGPRQFAYCLAPDAQGREVSGPTFLARVQACVPALTFLQSSVSPRFQETIKDGFESIVNSVSPSSSPSSSSSSSSFPSAGLTAPQLAALARLEDDLLQCGRHVCLLGPRASGKSHLLRHLSTKHALTTLTFPLHSELTSRDLLQRRVTDASGATTWVDSAIVQAARRGALCLLDGIHRIPPPALMALQRLLLDGTLDLPDGERLQAHANFRCVALGEAPECGQRFFSPADLNMSYYALPPMEAEDMVRACGGSSNQNAWLDAACRALHAEASSSQTASSAGMAALAPTMRHRKRLGALFPPTSSSSSSSSTAQLRAELAAQLLVRYQSEAVREAFDKVLLSLPVSAPALPSGDTSSPLPAAVTTDTTLTIGELSCQRRVPRDASYVPQPLFYDNANHTALLGSLLRAYSSGERAFLMIGNQGVGKNKLVDRFLSLLNAEREYIQLHRDSTVNSLTLIPALRDGKIVYGDSVVIKAARRGCFLVVDEADKAPSEISFVLKLIAEDGDLALSDGRRLLSAARYRAEGGDPAAPDAHTIVIHEDFRLVVLANRPGFPFLGNDFYQQIGGVFYNVIVENLDQESELALLQRYGDQVDVEILTKLSRAFALLREEHDGGRLAYPFSVRENVAVVRHINRYPEDGVLAAIEGILGFEQLAPSVRAHVAAIFQRAGIPVPLRAPSAAEGAGMPPLATLAQPIALPAAQSRLLARLGGPEGTVRLEIKPMKRSAWPSVQVTRAAAAFSSSRLDKFTEQLGSLQAQVNEGRMVGGVNDGLGRAHFLSVEPLAVHSYLDGLGSFLGASPSSESTSSAGYVAVELLSNDMGYRLGQFSPLLLPSAAGAVVMVPELSMALSLKFESDGAGEGVTQAAGSGVSVELLTVPLPRSLVLAPSSGGGPSIAKLFGGDAQGAAVGAGQMCSAYLQGGKGGAESVAVLYRKGGAELALLDFRRGLVGTFSLPYGRSVDQAALYASSSPADADAHSLLVSSRGDLFHVSVPAEMGGGGKVVVEAATLEGPAGAAVFNEMREQRVMGEGVYGGGPQSHGCVLSPSTVTHWPRLQAKPSEPLSVLLHAVTSAASIHNLTRTGDALHLEVVDTAAGHKRRLALKKSGGERVTAAVAGQPVVALAHESGRIDLLETCETSLAASLRAWRKMFKQPSGGANQRGIERVKGGGGEAGESVPRTGLGSPKHGQVDDKDHVGGNRWAGGTGGSDTAGLGGRGGPYRLDKGFPVRQVSDAEKSKVSAEARAEAARMASEALEKRLKEIKMGRGQFEEYLAVKGQVTKEIAEMAAVLDEYSRRASERVWLRGQAEGELDDARLVDGLTGDRHVFKRRVDPDQQQGAEEKSGGRPRVKRFHFLVDVSASMYRFNGSDGRLTRLLEAVLMLMEALACVPKEVDFDYAITGHSGDSPEIQLLDFAEAKPSNEKQRHAILEQMVSYAQYSQAGDCTLAGTERALRRTIEAPNAAGVVHPDDSIERRLFAISDANFERYNITPQKVKRVLGAGQSQCRADLILIASRDGEADDVARLCPGQVHLCLDSKDLPKLFKRLLLESFR